MNQLDKTADKLKKKLSLTDYTHDIGKDKQIDKDICDQQNVDESQKEVVKPLRKNKETKSKSTFYLSKTEQDMLLKMYIEGLKKNNKADKSMLVCEAIRLLYEKKYK